MLLASTEIYWTGRRSGHDEPVKLKSSSMNSSATSQKYSCPGREVNQVCRERRYGRNDELRQSRQSSMTKRDERRNGKGGSLGGRRKARTIQVSVEVWVEEGGEDEARDNETTAGQLTLHVTVRRTAPSCNPGDKSTEGGRTNRIRGRPRPAGQFRDPFFRCCAFLVRARAKESLYRVP
jgi:hypothetical protein